MSLFSDRLGRRHVFQAVGLSGLGLLMPNTLFATDLSPSLIDRGNVEEGKVKFPAWRGPADTPSSLPPAPLPPEQRVGFAIVGLGRLALEQILPAFAKSSKAKPVALVSGSPEKLSLVAKQYGISASACYSYGEFDRIKDNVDVKVVYVVLPNALHRAFTERAAVAGKHVLTEKPMSVSTADAKAMIKACKDAGVKLMVAYRIQYEPFNRRAHAFLRERKYGRLLAYHGVNTQTVAPDGANQWRHKKDLAGGGSLFDIGLYCLNTARFLTGEEPIEIYASIYSPPDDPRFAEVEETVSFMLRFPSNAIANCLTSYGGRDDKYQRMNCENAVLEMPNAFQYRGQRLSVIARQDDATSNNELVLEPKDQFAAEIDHMADCVLTGRVPYTPGEEGLQDHKLMEAIYKSANTGQPVKLSRLDGLDRFRGPALETAG